MDKDKSLNIQTSKDNRIGIMGGTFDPIHYAHLFIAQIALDGLNLDKILFIPTGKPPHKRENIITDACKRIDMLKLAIKSNPKFNISTTEITRKKTSYTIDTIKELQQYYDKETEFYFIMGSDAFKYVETWKNYRELFKVAKFIVMTRQILKNGSLDEKIRTLIKEHGADIKKIEIPFLDISSTIIRKRVGEGNPIKYLLPENVEKYIFDNRLYIK
ncbi:MAG TPA: nicotinate-nucleotide adenylyltransferase [Clostridia bacterium]|nr:nicotinate-nucleotide adenylyltransferase [Clostridia bacterium]